MPASVAGYSGTPLPKKLGLKEGQRVFLANAPRGFADELGPLPTAARRLRNAEAPLDFALLFVQSRAALEREFPELAALLAPAGMLWVAWPKKSSGVITDLGDEAVRTFGLSTGLVDTKVCAINETWSGLRFVIRVKDRAARVSRGR